MLLLSVSPEARDCAEDFPDELEGVVAERGEPALANSIRSSETRAQSGKMAPK
jgi:hypothetical protein